MFFFQSVKYSVQCVMAHRVTKPQLSPGCSNMTILMWDLLKIQKKRNIDCHGNRENTTLCLRLRRSLSTPQKLSGRLEKLMMQDECRNNIRIQGLGEKTEGKDPVCFFESWCSCIPGTLNQTRHS